MRSAQTTFLCLLLAGWAAAAPRSAEAGGGPENVLVVVNTRSWASRTLANHYVHLRGIAPSHVVHLDWNGSVTSTDVATFREQLLKPVIAAIEQRRLAGTIDYVVYSCDFPYAVNYRADFGEEQPAGIGRFTTASLTGLTYLAPLTLAGRPHYSQLGTNFYASHAPEGTRAFRSRYLWNARGERVERDGLRYLASTLLGYTAGRGNSVREVIENLEWTAAADHSRPEGTVYLMKNGDIRSRTRSGLFEETVAQLSELGVRAEIVEGSLPVGRDDVAGAVIGSASFHWPGSKSRILPGAICEHLTSFGGILRENAGQTPLTELLRHGAAGASGTVDEPYAILAKFPHPAMHAHYARGASLGEAFYLSVRGPYQLLIVGDPLCRPWAPRPARIALEGLPAGGEVRGSWELRPRADRLHLASWNFFLDGLPLGRCAPHETFTLDTTGMADGVHELRVTAIDDSPLEHQSSRVFPLRVANGDRPARVARVSPRTVRHGEPLRIRAAAAGARQWLVLHQARVVAAVEGGEAEVEIDTRALGLGPVRLQPVALFPGTDIPGKENLVSVAAAPLDVEILPPAELPANELPAGEPATGELGGTAAGLLLTRGDGSHVVLPDLAADWTAAARIAVGEKFQLAGWVRVPTADLYQLRLAGAGSWRVSCDGVVVLESESESFERHYAPLALAAGWHRLEVEGTRGSAETPRLWLGAAGTGPLTSFPTRHAPPEKRRPNIVLILADDLGWPTLGCYGSKQVPTPHLDRLAREGVRFTDAYVLPQCTPTRAALLTGRNTHRNGMWHVIGWYGYPWARVAEPAFVENLPRESFTLAKGLRGAGYKTALFGKWHLTRNDDGHYEQLKPEAAAHYGFDRVQPAVEGKGNRSPDKGVDFLTDQALAFMREHREEPFFVYLSHYTVHGPVLAPEELVEEQRKGGAPEEGHFNATYRAAIKHLDNSVGRLLAGLDELQLTQDTLVLFLSDNGGVDQAYDPTPFQSPPTPEQFTVRERQFKNAPLRAGKGSPYEGGIRVPWIARWPGRLPAGRTESTPVHAVDLSPTLLAAAGAAPPEGDATDGANLLPLLQGEAPLPPRPLLWYLPLYDVRWGATPCAVLREGEWKLIEYFGDWVDAEGAYHAGRRLELYHLTADLGETKNLAEEQPERAAAMSAKLRAMIEQGGAVVPGENPHFNPERALLEVREKPEHVK